MRLSRLSLALAALALLTACNFKGVPEPQVSARDAEWMAMVPKAQEDLRYGRYLIDDPTGEAPGTIVVDTKERFLYFVLPEQEGRSATASPSATRPMAGPACRGSPARPNGRTGTRLPR